MHNGNRLLLETFVCNIIIFDELTLETIKAGLQFMKCNEGSTYNFCDCLLIKIMLYDYLNVSNNIFSVHIYLILYIY